MLKHLIFAVLLLAACTSAAPERETQLARALTTIDARLQGLHRIEQDMLRNAGRPERVSEQRRKWVGERQQINELIDKARAAAVSESERSRVDQLAILAGSANARLEQVNAHVAQLNGEKR